MAHSVRTFLAYCCQQPTAICAGDVAQWHLAKELEADGLVEFEWTGPRSTVIRPTAEGRRRSQMPYA